MPILNKLRNAGIRAELFPDTAKMKKQMSYANAKQIPYVALAGDDEMKKGKITLKNMNTGKQELLTTDRLIQKLKK
jgi:histidyl-tRNA synthetase